MSDTDNQPVTEQAKSMAQVTLERIDRRDRVVRTLQTLLVMVVVGLNIFLMIRLQSVIDQNNTAALVRSQQAEQQRTDTQEYIKCVLLIRYDYPPETLSTRDAAQIALDTCATSERSR